MSIKKKFDVFIERFGHEILYVRRDLRFRCSCFVERSGESQTSCEKCLGTGYDIRIERIKTRRTVVNVPESLVGLLTQAPQGEYISKAYVYYISESIQPKDGDLLLEVEWSNSKRPTSIIQKHLISIAEPKFGDRGVTEFYQVYCKYRRKGETDDKTISGNPI